MIVDVITEDWRSTRLDAGSPYLARNGFKGWEENLTSKWHVLLWRSSHVPLVITYSCYADPHTVVKHPVSTHWRTDWLLFFFALQSLQKILTVGEIAIQPCHTYSNLDARQTVFDKNGYQTTTLQINHATQSIQRWLKKIAHDMVKSSGTNNKPPE